MNLLLLAFITSGELVWKAERLAACQVRVSSGTNEIDIASNVLLELHQQICCERPHALIGHFRGLFDILYKFSFEFILSHILDTGHKDI